MKFQDYYELLGVARTAKSDDVKSAYRKLAMKWHPDTYKGTDKKAGEATFKRINEAYEVLSDPEKRTKYDALGADWEHGREYTPPPSSAGSAGGRGAGTRQMSPEEFAAMFGQGGFSDFFASTFGEDMARGAPRGAGARHARFRHRGADVRAELHVPIGDAIRGGKRTFSIVGHAACPRCGGVGSVEGHVCPTCAGVGHVDEPRTVELALPKELREGASVRLRGLGGAGESGGDAGDLYLEIHLDDDDVHRLKGNDLEADLPVAPWEALAGAKVDVRTAAGVVALTIPAGTASGARLRLRAMGFSDGQSSRGDFFAVIRHALPTALTPRQRELIIEAGAAGGDPVTGGARAGGTS